MQTRGSQQETGETSEVSRTSEVRGPRTDYISYLVRLWRVGQEERWRGSLQRPGTEEPIWFADLEELVAFLRAETGTCRRLRAYKGEEVTIERED